MTPEEMKRVSRGISRDMSPEAIGRRLDIISELFDLTSWLSKAKYVGKVEELKQRSTDTRTASPDAAAHSGNLIPDSMRIAD